MRILTYLALIGFSYLIYLGYKPEREIVTGGKDEIGFVLQKITEISELHSIEFLVYVPVHRTIITKDYTLKIGVLKYFETTTENTFAAVYKYKVHAGVESLDNIVVSQGVNELLVYIPRCKVLSAELINTRIVKSEGEHEPSEIALLQDSCREVAINKSIEKQIVDKAEKSLSKKLKGFFPNNNITIFYK